MWVQAGQRSDDFWHQTPRSFQVVMIGVRRAKEIEAEQRFLLAYETAGLTAAAQAGKLKKYHEYIRKADPVATPEAMLAALKSLGGSTMTVREIKK